jgi:cytochrome c-type biogenesis protein CcmF
VGTALMHSLAVTEKRGGFKIWTVLLAIMAFSLSLLGTFLVRSGVLTSVHAFATDPRRGIFILAFLAVVIGSSLLLFAWRAPRVGLGGKFDPVSRESALLTNNVLLVVAAASVLLGTLYPLFLDALDLGKISVGPPYFESVFVPLMAPAIFLMGIGPLAKWKQAELPDLAMRLKWAFAVAVVAAAVLPFLMGRWSPMIFLGLALAFWVFASGVVNVRERVLQLRSSNGGSTAKALRAQPRGYWGMLLAHAGVAVFIIGVTMVRGYETEKDVKMKAGDIVEVGGYGFRLDGFARRNGPNFEATVGKITVLKDGRELRVMSPEKRFYPVQQMPMTEADMDSGLTRDLYVSLGEPVGDDAWIVRIYHKPFIDWIWGGCFLMALGGLLAITDKRYRIARREADASARASTAPVVA